ncbi:MAG: hypothetical protein AAF652_16680 [Cyanobacteria bacterium P01_C01_bin.72]
MPLLYEAITMNKLTKKTTKIFFSVTGIAFLTASFSLPKVNAQKLGRIERKIELSEVPTTVLSTARATSGGEPTKAQVQINPDGSTVYELGGQNQQGFDFEIEIDPNGKIIEIDEQIESSAVPEEVKKIFKYWLPEAKMVSTWRSTRYTSFEYFYEIIISDDFWVEIPADGKTVKINPLN